ncbi:hypothetical protein DKT69_30345 [Micromonospora sicca]|uniref:Uncharacterized protein n=1 Tax=Micromonospora sicca TaxID=2202420 RepID=A0A317D4T5_9ACTN|nr:hypothetical protein DKT69_30345 [Micromonospora sp. 4G51]
MVAGGPPPTAPAIASASPDRPAGVEADRQRISAAMLAAIDREAPGLRWVPGPERNRNIADWTGPTVDTPSWPVNQFSHLSASGWIGFGVAARGDVRAWLSIEISTPKPGQPAETFTCFESARACETSRGPNGERIRYLDLNAWYAPPGQRPTPLADRSVEVIRPDGTRVSVQASSSSTQFLLTVAEMTGIGLDQALALH